MTESPQPEDNNLVVRDAQGDPLPLGTRMLEKESYERVIEGLKLAAEGAAHLAVHYYRAHEITAVNAYSGLARRFDELRLLAVEIAGAGDRHLHKETQEVRGNPLAFIHARVRLRNGLKQAGGGMRQLATCHRGDLRWSIMASQIEEMHRKLTTRPSSILRPPANFKLH